MRHSSNTSNTEGIMREKLVTLRIALEDVKRASVFRKAQAAEKAILIAVNLVGEMVEEIEKLKEDKPARTGKEHA